MFTEGLVDQLTDKEKRFILKHGIDRKIKEGLSSHGSQAIDANDDYTLKKNHHRQS